MRLSWRLAAALAGALIHAQAPAQDVIVYIGDSLQVGLHETPEIASPILTLLPAGAPLEVLERAGDMARVQLADGKTGWVDARFLTETPPGRVRVEELERELAGAQAALADAEAKMVAAAQSAQMIPTAGTETAAQAIPSEALREMQLLAEENQRLKQQVAELEAVQRMRLEQATAAAADAAAVAAPAPAALPLPVPVPELVPAGRWQTWQLVLVASILLLAFSAGGWLVDWSVRRRHGGFRV